MFGQTRDGEMNQDDLSEIQLFNMGQKHCNAAIDCKP